MSRGTARKSACATSYVSLGGAVEVRRSFEKLEFTVRGSLLSLAQDGRQLLAGKRFKDVAG